MKANIDDMSHNLFVELCTFQLNENNSRNRLVIYDTYTYTSSIKALQVRVRYMSKIEMNVLEDIVRSQNGPKQSNVGDI